MHVNENSLINALKNSLHRTENGQNSLNEEILKLEGMSGTLYRKFINDLIKSLQDINYLEIGCWKGSTLISALYDNLYHINNYIAIDSWHEFGGPKEEFTNNFKKYIKQEPNLIDNNCFKVETDKIGIQNINIYFYDGGHSENDHIQALTHYFPLCDDCFIYIVDDYNWPHVVAGTYKGIINSNLKIVYETSKFTKGNGVKETWWNGVGIFVLKK